jgi:hypothetical protein
VTWPPGARLSVSIQYSHDITCRRASAFRGAGGELDRYTSAPGDRRDAPGGQIAADPHHGTVAADKKDVDRKPHAERVYLPAPRDYQGFLFTHAVSPDQAAASVAPG